MDILELGYVLVGAPRVAGWRAFAEETLGAMTVEGPAGALYVKIDERAFRLAVIPDREDGLIACGWLMAGPEAFRAARTALCDDGVAVEDGDAVGAGLRRVQAYCSFKDPAGHTHEFAWGPISDFRPFTSPAGVSGFVTKELGMGHVALSAAETFDEEVAFWTRRGWLRLCDLLHVPGPAGPARINFFHCANGRQHSLALGELAVPGGCIHVMLEVMSLDDVGRCLDRAAANDVKLTAPLGRHVNDEMISFYMQTPGGFSLEYGCGGKVMNWNNHIVFETTRGSDWGHQISLSSSPTGRRPG